MRIRTQFTITLVIFSILLIVIGASLVINSGQVSKTRSQETLANNIAQGAGDLSYLSSDYVIYHGTQQVSQWQTRYISFSADVDNLSVDTSEQQTLVTDIQANEQRMKTVFDSIVSTTQNQNSTDTVSALQVSWSRMSIQSQTVVADATNLAQMLRVQVDQLNMVNYELVLAMIGVFSVFFVAIYTQIFRRTLKSISDLREGTAIIGSGNLDYKLTENKKNEIGELSHAFNQMTANLKTVTASKTDLEQAQASLRGSEQRWATTLSSVGDSVIATELSGNVSFMNAVAEELTGWKSSEALGKPLKEVFHIINEETRREVESPVSKVLEKGMIVGLANHTILVRRDSSEVPLDDSGAPIKDENGNVTGVVLVFHDITERKKNEEATAKQAELIDLSPDAIIVRKLDGTITFWSAGAEKLYGYTKQEADGKNTHTLLNTKFPMPLAQIEKQLEKEGKWSGEITHFCKDASKIVVQSYWLGKFGSDGKIFEVFESNVDITDRIEMQLKLEDSAVRVEEYANQMETLANERAAQLKDAERLAAIGATAGMVGHDIRNPLQAITSDVYLAKTELATTADSEEKKNALESLEEIEKNIFYINKIVADLQDYARPLKPIAKETNLQKLVDDLIVKSGVPKNVKVQVKIQKKAETIMADSDILRRVLGNLVTNAVQAMPEGGQLSIQAYKEANDSVITVSDTGVGIAEEAKNKLFTPLFTTKSKGQGFGLAVVKRMTESLGGSVSFDSEQGKGTKFILRFPIKS